VECVTADWKALAIWTEVSLTAQLLGRSGISDPRESGLLGQPVSALVHVRHGPPGRCSRAWWLLLLLLLLGGSVCEEGLLVDATSLAEGRTRKGHGPLACEIGRACVRALGTARVARVCGNYMTRAARVGCAQDARHGARDGRGQRGNVLSEARRKRGHAHNLRALFGRLVWRLPWPATLSLIPSTTLRWPQ
jgi:hypothetical protein